MKYEAVIGLEIHVQLKTQSKMFCRCSNDSDGIAPNTNVCEVCFALPGTLPVPNRAAIEMSLRAAKALGCSIPDTSKFDRKQYFYPDLPKGYQISQYDEPLGGPGEVEFDFMTPDGKLEIRKVGITRLHLEEDAGKLVHPKGSPFSLVDLNRAGTPLAEIVTDPIVTSLEEAPGLAKAFLQELRLLMRHLKVSDADMEKGHLRADANISIHPFGSKNWGSKVEIKNLNSFRFVERGIRSEIERQQKVLDGGGKVTQETRGYDETTGETVSQRSKEEAMDYRYFPDPDLPPLKPLQILGNVSLPKTPIELKRRWRSEGVNEDMIGVLVADPVEATQFDSTPAEHRADVAKIWTFLRSEIEAVNDDFTNFCVEAAAAMREGRVAFGKIKLLWSKAGSGKSVSAILASDPEFKTVSAEDLQAILEDVLKTNQRAVEDYRDGNENAKKALVGAAMKATRGSADPKRINALLDELLK